MPKRLRPTLEDDDFSFMTDPFSLLPSVDDVGFPDSDIAWAFDMNLNAGPDQAQLQSAGPVAGELGTPNGINPGILADILARPGSDFSTSYQTSNGSSSVPSSSGSHTALSLLSTSSSPRHSVPVEAEPPSGQATVCLCRSESCLTAALRMMTTLHVAHSACLSAHQDFPPLQQARTMETVLSLNKDVAAGISPILDCACSAKSLIQLLLTIICGHLIAWNSAMITADLEQSDDSPQSALSSAGSLSSGGALGPKARVLAQPITIGQHQIDGSLGRALRAQVMAGELRVLEGLVDALCRRFSETSRLETTPGTPTGTQPRGNNGRCSPSSESKGLSNVVHRNIISSLRTRLQITRAEIFSRLGSAAWST